MATAFVLDDLPARSITAEEYEAMVYAVDLGRTELLRGVICERVSGDPPHETLKRRLSVWLIRGLDPDEHWVRVEGFIRVSDRLSLPVPDIAVQRAAQTIDHPSELELVVEVADSSLRKDAKIKAPMYAESQVPEYWVVDVNGRQVIRFTEPGPTEYGRRDEIATGTIIPARLEIEPLDLGELFAGLG